MKEDKVSSYIGLTMKAGRLANGEFAVEKSVKEGKAHLVILASDASENTKKKFTDMCRYYNVQTYVYADKESLGHMIGREQRACISINDAALARTIIGAFRKRVEKEILYKG